MDKDDGSDCEIDKKQLCKFFCGTEVNNSYNI